MTRAIGCGREMVQYDADETSQHMRRSKQLLTSEFFAARRVGLLGAGS